MFRDRIPSRQLSAWLFAGTTPVLLQMLSGGSWLWIGIAGMVSALLAMWVWRSGWEPKKWQCPILIIWIIILMGQLLADAANSWPVGKSYPAVPLMLLVLAGWSAQKGPSAAARVGTVLFWFVLIMYLVVFGAGAKDIELEWLRPKWDMLDTTGLALFLVPSVAACLLCQEQKGGVRLVLPAIFALCGALITSGVLSSDVTRTLDNGLYEMSRSINIAGVARRFEPLISAGMTVGWFAMLSLLLAVAGVLTQELFSGWGKTGLWLVAVVAAVWMLCGLHISGWIVLISGAVFWGLIPIVTQGLDNRKKS